MPQFLSGAWDWFWARGRGQKAGIIVLAFIVVLVTSRVLAGLAMLAFFSVVVVMIVQRFRRRPAKKWAMPAAWSLAAAILFSSIAGAVYGPQTGQGGQGGGGEEQAEKQPQQEPERTKVEEAKPPPSEEQAEKLEAAEQPARKDQKSENAVQNLTETSQQSERQTALSCAPLPPFP